MERKRWLAVCLVLVVFLTFVLASQTLADTGLSKLQDVGAEMQSPGEAVSSRTRTEELKKEFYHALNSIYGGQFGEAAQKIGEVREQAVAAGYRNLPDFSFQLIRIAEQLAAGNKLEESSFLLRKAALLSPRHAGVQLGAASLASRYSLGNALEYFVDGLVLLPYYPVISAASLLTLAMVSVVALTVALLIGTVVQLLRNIDIAHQSLARLINPSRRGFVAPIILLVILIAPLLGGLLLALSFWGLFLAYIKDGRTKIDFFAGLLTIAWSLLLSVVTTVGGNVELEANRVIEDLSNLAFSPRGEEIVQEELKANPSDPVMLFAKAQLYQGEGLSGEAGKIYDHLIMAASTPKLVGFPALINRSAIAYSAGEYAQAKELLLQAARTQPRSFELNYNLALAHLALLDTQAYRDSYLKAKAANPSRMAEMEKSADEKRLPLLKGLTAAAYYSLLTKKTPSTAGQELKLTKREAVAKALVAGGTSKGLLVAGIFLLCVSFVIHSKGVGRRRVERPELLLLKKEPSFFWSFVPAGGLLSGEQPVAGVLLLTVFLTLVMLGIKFPVVPYGSLPVDCSFTWPFFGIALALFVASSFMAALCYLSRRKGGVGDVGC